jgi:hypothetical protein
VINSRFRSGGRDHPEALTSDKQQYVFASRSVISP